MRLIDADKLYRLLCNEQTSHRYFHNLDAREGLGKALEILDEQPTAYDVDKVIKQLEERLFSAEVYNDDLDGCDINDLLCMGDVIEIVEAGGIDG